ncbi:hypothetical protein CVT24_003751, partial [Panaeolus cyanescens]
MLPITPSKASRAIVYTLSPIKFIINKVLAPAAEPSGSSPSTSSPGGSTLRSPPPRRRPAAAARREVQRQNSLRKERSFRINERSSVSTLPVERLGEATAAAVQSMGTDPTGIIIAEQVNKLFQARNAINEQLAGTSLADISQHQPFVPTPLRPSVGPTRHTPTTAAARQRPYPLQPKTMPRRSARLNPMELERKKEEAARAFLAKQLREKQEAERKQEEEDLARYQINYREYVQEVDAGLNANEKWLDTLKSYLQQAQMLCNALDYPVSCHLDYPQYGSLLALRREALDAYKNAMKAGNILMGEQDVLIATVEARSASWIKLRSSFSSLHTSFYSAIAKKDETLALLKEVKQRQQECFGFESLTETEEKLQHLAQVFKNALELARAKNEACEAEKLRIMDAIERAARERELQEELHRLRVLQEQRRAEEEARRVQEREREMAACLEAERERAEVLRRLEEAARLAAEARRVAEEQAAYRAQAEWEKEQILRAAQAEWEREQMLKQAQAQYMYSGGYQGYGQHTDYVPADADASMRTACNEELPRFTFTYSDISMADCTAQPFH